MDRGDSFTDDIYRFAPVTTGPNATHYNMNHKDRGMAVILSHKDFEVPGTDLNSRTGTKFDADSIAKTLDELGFFVTTYCDLEYARLKEVVDNAAAYDHSDYDCFIMVVLTHGTENNMLFCYDQEYDFEDLWAPFSANLCASLAGKPKLFFVQACRGNKYMPLVSLKSITETDGIPNNIIYNIPSKADFLFAFATIPEKITPWQREKFDSSLNPSLYQEFFELKRKDMALRERTLQFEIQKMKLKHPNVSWESSE